MRRKIAAILAACIAALGLAVVTEVATMAPAHATGLIGCGKDNDRAYYMKDVFWRSHVAGYGGQDFVIFMQHHYYWCARPNDPDKVLQMNARFCARKTDGVDYIGDHPLRGFNGRTRWDTEGGTADANTLVRDMRIDWNGNGSEGDQRCSDWVETYASVHWQLLKYDPYQTGSGSADIVLAPDRDFFMVDDSTGTYRHYYHPLDDELIAIIP